MKSTSQKLEKNLENKNKMDDIIFDIALSYENSITCIEKRILIEEFGYSKNILEMDVNKLKNILGRRWSGKSFNKEMLLQKAREAFLYIKKAGVNVYRFWDDGYPENLKKIPDFPFLIYVKGNIHYNFEKAIAVVGTRVPDEEGINITMHFVKDLVKRGYTIISGLAIGIDTIAHLTALNCDGCTIGVIGCGIDRIYPAVNKSLVREIINKGGAIISEYPPGILPNKWNFPKRNRIIVGLASKVLITQSPEKSGTIITGNLALTYNRKLYVFDNSSDNIKNLGNKKFILLGAMGVKTPCQIL